MSRSSLENATVGREESPEAGSAPPSDVGDALASRLASLSPAQRALLERRLAERAALAERTERARAADPERPELVRLEGDRSEMPASFGQQRLWFLHRLDPDSPAYLLFFGYRFDGSLDADRFRRSLDRVVERHEVLRTRFVATETGGLAQRVEPPSPVDLPIFDVSALPPEERQEEALQIARRESRRRFDPRRPPLFRASLVRLGAEEHLFLLYLHHIVFDGWSMGVMMREVAALYEGELAGRPVDLPDLPLQYGDFAAWQERWWQSPAAAKRLAYWKGELSGLPPVLDLPTDRPRPKTRRGHGERAYFALSEDVSRRLAELARRHGTTRFTVLMALFHLLLHRLTGRTRIPVATPFAGRTAPELEGLIGFFVNTLVLTGELAGDPTIDECVERFKERVSRAQVHQELPFEKLVEELQPERTLSHAPLAQVLFAFQGGPGGPGGSPGLSGLEVTPVEIAADRSQFDFALYMAEARTKDGSARLEGYAEYATDLLDRTTSRRFVGWFETLCAAAADDPGRRVGALPMIPASQRHQAVVEWNDTRRAFPNGLLHQGIEEWARSAPDAIAVDFGTECLSYGAFDRRVNRLAHHLRALGVGPETLVGVMLPRSTDLVVALVAILRTGGAFVPIDLAWPEDRLRFVLEDAGLRVVVATEELAAGAPLDGVETVLVDAHRERFAARPDHEPVPVTDPDNLAYMIYTSGSTGRPKGTLARHAGVLNRVQSMEAMFGLTTGDRVLQKTPVSFDVSVWEFFWTLRQGARLVVPRAGGHRDSRYLATLIAQKEVTVLHFVPSMLRIFLREPLAADCQSMRILIASGEELTPDLVEEARSLWRTRLINYYGATEASIDTTWWESTGPVPRGRVPIGRAMLNDGAFVRAQDGGVAPIGVLGEVMLSGVGVGRGYLGRPSLTADRFVPDPYGDGARLYRTGDLGRAAPDGNLEFFGRLDFQVKIRGFRIELGEIEAALEEHPGVARCVVKTVEGGDGQPQIAAYVVAAGAPLGGGELADHLRDRLPEYMVPAVFVPMDAIPLSATGKADRKALPAPDPSAFTADGPYEAPRHPDEELMAGLWVEALGVDRVGRRDDFFSLGGHSLLALRILSRIREVFGVDLPVDAMFEKPTVAGLAESVREAAGRPGLPPIEPADRDRPLPLSFGQRRLWFLDQLVEESNAYNMPVALRIRGPLDRVVLGCSLDEIVRRHEVLRTRFPTTEDGPYQEVLPPRPQGLSVVDLSGLSEPAREARAALVGRRLLAQPFDLAERPPLRLALVRLGPEDSLLLVVTHHIVFDGSVGTFLRELARIYEGLFRGEGAPPPPALQYADFAAWQRRWLTPEVAAEQTGFWRDLLGSDLTPLHLPTDRPRPPAQSFRGRLHTFSLPEGIGPRLEAFAVRGAATPFMVTVSAFAALLGRHADQTGLRVGMPIMDRPQAELQDSIGCYVNTLVLPFALDGDGSFEDLVASTRRVTLGAYRHKELPFDLLVETLQPQRDLSLAPLFQVMFTFQDTRGGTLEAPASLEFDLPPVDAGSARFDLLLAVTGGEGEWTGRLEYNSDLFDAATVERLTRQLGRLLDAAVADPRLPLRELPMLAPAEVHQIVHEWNDTAGVGLTEAALGGGLHQAFERRAAEDPGALAVVDPRRSLGREELNREANRLAHALIAAGVTKGSMVGIHLGRSTRTVAAVLAVLKTGAAYVPISVGYPPERVRYVLERLGVRHLVTQPDLLREAGPRLVDLPRLDHLVCPWVSSEVGEPFVPAELRDRMAWRDRVDRRPEHDPGVPVDGDDLAYVIFTSGSTGRPKGVMVTHAAAANLVDWVNSTFGVGEDDRVLFVNSLSFDLSVYDIFGPLSAGGSIRVARAPELAEPASLAELLAAPETTIWNSAPAALQQVLPFLPDGPIDDAGLRLTLASGDWIPVQQPNAVRARFPESRFVSLGGATEATVWSNWFPVERVHGDWTSIPYGRPIRDARYHVLDEGLRPCPIGVPGDLFIGGDCLATAYAAAGALTADRFVPDPFSSGGERLYRTGDRARYWPGGDLEFLGRLDQQVKIRGYRIELGEIETVLAESPAVRDAVVMAPAEGRHERRLMAWVVLAPDASVDEVRRRLEARLPAYMVPSAIQPIAAIPLTANGKVDRKALPMPGVARAASGRAAHSATERRVAEVWSEVLGVEMPGPNDDFFELGGHSLLATQVLARLRKSFGVDLALRVLFESPRLADVARAIEAAGAGGARPAPPLVTDPDASGPRPVSFSQQRLWLEDRLRSAGAAYNIPTTFHLAGRLDFVLFDRALRFLQARHETLRTRFVEEDGEPRQVIEPSVAPPMSQIDLRGLPESRRESESRRLSHRLTRMPFDLRRAPLYRCVFLRTANDEARVSLTMHHIVSDGWSVGILVRDLAAAYAALAEGRRPDLPDLPVQYADYAAWQRGWLRGAALEERLDYWREQLRDLPDAAGPPYDFEPEPGKRARVGLATLELTAPWPARLRELGRAHDATLFMTLLAAFQAALFHVTGRDDQSTGISISGRREVELEDVVGLFINTLVLRTDLGGDPTFGELLDRVRRTTLDGYAHQDLPYERIVEELPSAGGRRSALYGTTFMLQNFPGATTELPGLALTRVRSLTGEMRSDLDFEAFEDHDRIAATLRFDKHRYERATVERFLRHLSDVLTRAAEDPSLPLSALAGAGSGADVGFGFSDDLEWE